LSDFTDSAHNTSPPPYPTPRSPVSDRPLPHPASLPPLEIAVPSTSSLHTSSAPSSSSRRPLHPAFPGSRDSALPANPSRGPRESAQSSAPANYGRLQECTS